MNTSHTIQSLRKRYFIYGITFFLINSSLILTNLLSIKISPFQKPILINFSLHTTSTITSMITTTDINEVLCNHHDVNTSHDACEQIRCIVIIRKNGGRLSNRMFIFASGYGLARAHGCRFHASKRIIKKLFNYFNITIKEDIWLSKEEIDNINDFVIKDTVCTFLPDMLRPNAFKHIELQGYWQSYLYFDAYRDEIREIYTARSDTLSRLSEYFSSIIKTDCQTCFIPSYTSHNNLRQIIRINYNITWIGIHIRRLDFRLLNYTSNKDYIYRAIKYYKQRYYNHKIRFLVTSDDKSYCEKLF